jgi:beta-glucosidase
VRIGDRRAGDHPARARGRHAGDDPEEPSVSIEASDPSPVTAGSPASAPSGAAERVALMTLDEKASLCSGRDFWTTKPVERVGVPSVVLTDGPHGVRLQVGETDHLGLSVSEPATCFPTASALAATWDRDLVAEVAAAIADECLEFGVDVLLGPGVNLKRSPLCGRNFEYFSEDPLVAGELATAFVEAVQARGVGTSLKHFAGNDQEHRRLIVDAIYDERTLRELELTAFELPVTRARPWTVMGAYNRLNGTYACEHPWLLTELLRDEWGHLGIVVTDWGATNDRVAGLVAGCELEMPATGGSTDAQLVEAVRSGALDEAVLDRAATRLVELALRAQANRQPGARFDRDAHHALARRAAADAAVLLRNEAAALPLRDTDRIALLGAFAETPRFQGTGSSRINPTRVDTLRTELGALVGQQRIRYAPGYDHPTTSNAALLREAVAAAEDSDVAIVCVGLPDGYENEGNDRTHLRLPPTHDALVAAVAAVHDRVVVVLSNGAPVEMPWVEDVEAVLEGYLGGQAGAGGVADVITGTVDPGGHLAETFPRHLDDVPTARHFPGGPATVQHREGLYVGYRFHDTVDADVLFPFGHGLSYTSFELGEVTLDRGEVGPDELAGGGTVTITVDVTNIGGRAGTQVVQVYVRDPESCVYRPDRELRAFAKVALEPGANTRVELPLGQRAFAFWDTAASGWTVEPGAFEVLVGFSSRDLRGRAELTVTGEPLPVRDEPAVYRRPPRYLDVDAASYEALLGRPLPPEGTGGPPYTRNSTLSEVAHTPVGRVLVRIAGRRLRAGFGDDPANEALVASMLQHSPLRVLTMGGVSSEHVDHIVDLVNGRWLSGGKALLTSLAREWRPERGPWRRGEDAGPDAEGAGSPR